MPRQRLAWGAGLVVLLAAGSGFAAQLVYFDENGWENSPRGLYNFDTQTGISTLRTTVPGTTRFFAMDVRQSDQKVFAIDLGGGLWTLNINSGQSTLIGQTGIRSPVSLAVNSTTGAMYVLTVNGLYNPPYLYSVDPATGAAVRVGQTGVASRGLAFSPVGELFAFGDLGTLYRVNPATGQVSGVGGSGNPVPIRGDIHEDATFTRSGELFACSYQGIVYQTDPVTGDGRMIGYTHLADGMLGLIEVPEPATAWLVALGTLGVLGRRRQPRQNCFGGAAANRSEASGSR